MKSPLAQLLFLTVFVGVGLWASIKWFLGGTHEYSQSIDVRSAAYAPRPAGSGAQSEENASDTPAPDALGAAQPMRTANELEVTGAEAAMAHGRDEIEGGQIREDDEHAEQGKQATENNEVLEVVATVVSQSEAQSDGLAESLAGDTDRASDDTRHETVALGAQELSMREQARKRRLAELGLISEKPPKPTIAVDVSLIMPETCAGAAVASVPVGLKFRYESAILRGESLNALESLVALYRDCEQGEFVLDENPLGRADASDALKKMRFDEVKYFFIQHSVSTDSVRFPKEP